MELGFGEALLLIGALLAVSAALSGVMKGTVLSISVLSVGLGIALAAAGVVEVDARDTTVIYLIELALVLTLFSDGMFVERELLRRHWSPVARSLVLAMPITLGLLALAAKGLFPALTWAEAFLLAAVLTPTDPVVTSSVVTARRVPGVVRHTLNLESGLNDGLALPFVLFFLVLASPGGDAGSEAANLAGEAAVGAAIGILLGVAGGRLHDRLPGGGITPRYEGIYAVGFGLAAFVLAALVLARPVAVLLSFLRTGLPRSQQLFIAWFGPKGVASMLFALFVLKSGVGSNEEIFDIAAFVILSSIAAHGLTDTVGAGWIGRRENAGPG